MRVSLPLARRLLALLAVASFTACEDAVSPTSGALTRLAASPSASFSNAWQHMPSLSGPRENMAAVSLNGCVWSIAGRGAGDPTRMVQQLCGIGGTPFWSPGPRFPEALYDFAGAGVIGNDIYVAGGLSAQGAASDALYVLHGGVWTVDPEPLPARMACGAGAVANGKLYVFARNANPIPGYPGLPGCLDALGNVFAVYDPALPSPPRWRVLPRPPADEIDPAMAELGGRLYVVGGADPGGLYPVGIDVFDLTTEQWAPMTQRPASLPVGKVGGELIAANGWLFALGGDDSSPMVNPSQTVYSYDPSTNTWDEQRWMGTHRTHLGAGLVGSTIVALGGSTWWATGDKPTATVESWLTPYGCDPHEPDDDAAHALPWSVFYDGEFRGPITQGRICGPADVDLFAIGRFLTTPQTLTLTLTSPAGADYELELLDATGTRVLAASANPGALVEHITRGVEPGRHYVVRVRSQNGSFDPVNPYRLDWR